MIEQDAVMHLYAINEHFRVGTAEALVSLRAAYDDGVMVSKTDFHLTHGREPLSQNAVRVGGSLHRVRLGRLGVVVAGTPRSVARCTVTCSW